MAIISQLGPIWIAREVSNSVYAARLLADLHRIAKPTDGADLTLTPRSGQYPP